MEIVQRESESAEVQRAGGKIHLILTTAARVKCQCGAGCSVVTSQPQGFLFSLRLRGLPPTAQ